MNSPDYLKQLFYCRNLDKMSMLIRAFGCYVSARFVDSSPKDCLWIIRQYESDASFVQNNCPTVKDAKRFLKEKGYF